MAELRDGRSGLLRIGSIEPAASERVMPLLGQLQRERPGAARAARRLGHRGRQPRRRRRRARRRALLRAAGRARPALRASLRRGDGPARPARPPPARSEAAPAADLDGEPLLLTEQGCSYRGAVETGAAGARRAAAMGASRAAAPTRCARPSARSWGSPILPRGRRPLPRRPGTVVRRLSRPRPSRFRSDSSRAPTPRPRRPLSPCWSRPSVASWAVRNGFLARYSLLRTRIGSTASARRAGIEHARTPASRRTAATAANETDPVEPRNRRTAALEQDRRVRAGPSCTLPAKCGHRSRMCVRVDLASAAIIDGHRVPAVTEIGLRAGDGPGHRGIVRPRR